MNLHYLTGVALGVLGGFLTQGGQLLEKKAVNRIRQDFPDKGFMKALVKSPVWVVGFFLGLGCGTIAYMLAQNLIGPALVPGLMASGLIVLAIGSVKMNQEKLNNSEIFGIFLMVSGILFLGLSGLGINSTQVKSTLADPHALRRIAIFTLGFIALFISSRLFIIRRQNRKGLFIALGNGFLSCLSDFWINPLLALVAIVVAGHGSVTQAVIVCFAALILIFCASVITWQNQVAFKVAQASNIVPVAQVPIQIAPVLVYFYVFALIPTSSLATFYLVAGSIITIFAGFLLGRRQDIQIPK